MSKEKLKPLIFYVVFFLFILAFSTTANYYDYDLWARLIAGMGFVQTGHVLKQDFLSYTPTHTWYDHEWGSGVIFYLTQHFFPYYGIIFLQAILVFLIFFFIIKIVELRGTKTTSAYNFLFYYFAVIAFSYVFQNPIRCHLFSFLFFTVFLYILELSRQGKNKPLWALPFIMILWNNLHGGCVSGIGLIILYIIGEFLNKKPIKKYIYTLIATVIILPINPWGIEYLEFLVRANFMKRPAITEWMSPFSKIYFFDFLKFKFFMAFLVLAEIIKKFITKDKNSVDKTKVLVLFTTFFLAAQHIKLIPLSVITFSCFCYEDFYILLNSATKNFFNKIALWKDSLVYILIVLLAFSTIKMRGFGPYVSMNIYPIKAIEFIKINKIEGPLLTNFGFGSYAAYKLYPYNKIFMDGRYEEVYYDFMIPCLANFHVIKNQGYKLLEFFPPDVMLLEKCYPIAEAMKRNKDWKAIFEDKLFVVFVKAAKAKKTYKKPSSDINYYRGTIFDTDINFMLQSKHDKK